MPQDNILIWLPSPMGDAILATPALRSIREHFGSAKITFLANNIVRQVLSPCDLNDAWLDHGDKNLFTTAKMIKSHNFTHAILFKNSFASALAVFLAGIGIRVGYARDGRGFLLSEKLYPPKTDSGKFKPTSMLDYYLAIASWLGADTSNRQLELAADPEQLQILKSKLPELFGHNKPIIILVPGGAFGPSKCWPSDRFAKTADRLIEKYNAIVVVSVSPDPFEKKIADQICGQSTNELVNLADTPLPLGQLKSLFSTASLVISNDTGPRHIALALKRKTITLFGPNDAAWTNSGCENEIQIIGQAPCAPCQKGVCKKDRLLCMEDITVEMVTGAADKLLQDDTVIINRNQAEEFIEISRSFFINADHQIALSGLGLDSFDGVFAFDSGENLAKPNLAKHRTRIQFQIDCPPKTLFLKRYDNPPIWGQLKNFLSNGKRCATAYLDFTPAEKLASLGIRTPKTIAYGWQWGRFFEKRSFIITEKIPNAQSLEKSLPRYCASGQRQDLELKRQFVGRLAEFIKKFHATGYRHRDLYLCHIFYDTDDNFHLIDLARAFKPLRSRRFVIKDIAQLYYSAPTEHFTKTDRLRFYKKYADIGKLSAIEKAFIRHVIGKAGRIARHDLKRRS